jgi:hypothetical protein
MTQLNADAIITLTSAIPALFIASLSAWLAYLTLRRGEISRNDIETSTIEFILAHTSTTSSRYISYGLLYSCFLTLNVLVWNLIPHYPEFRRFHYCQAKAFFNCNSHLQPSCATLIAGQGEPDLCHPLSNLPM